MLTGSSINGTIVVPAAGSVSIRSMIPSPLASADRAGQAAAFPSVKPWKCCQWVMLFGSPVASVAMVRLSPLTVKVTLPAAAFPVTVVFIGASFATYTSDACAPATAGRPATAAAASSAPAMWVRLCSMLSALPD